MAVFYSLALKKNYPRRRAIDGSAVFDVVVEAFLP